MQECQLPIVEKDKKVDRDFFQKSMGIGFAVALFGSITVYIVGDEQMKYLVEEQPMKFAAMEGTYEDTGRSCGMDCSCMGK